MGIYPNTKIARVEAFYLENIPIQPPPFRDLPNVEESFLVRVETDDGIVGWGMGGYVHPHMLEFINKYVAPILLGEDPFHTERLFAKFDRHSVGRFLGQAFIAAYGVVDVALWDIKGKAIGKPVHHLLGGAREKVPVYITHGAAYGGAPVYSMEELAAEAAHLVKLGNNHIKNTVGRQAVPDPEDDYRRMRTMREAIGPDVKLAMDGNCRMTAPQAVRLCRLCEELNISFLEEPCLENDPVLLRELKSQTCIPIAASENHKFTMRDLLAANCVDIVQPNVANDGGYTGSLRIASLARSYNKFMSHGNGSGPHNIALHAGLMHGGLVEYHFHKWMAYNAIFENVPQPENGFLHLSQDPGFGLEPKDGLIEEYAIPAGAIPAKYSGKLKSPCS